MYRSFPLATPLTFTVTGKQHSEALRMTADPSLAPPLDDAVAPSALETTPQELFVEDSLAMPEDIQEFLSGIDPLDSVELLLDSTDRGEAPTIAAHCVSSTNSSAIDSSDNDSSVAESSNLPNPVIKHDRRCGHRPGAVRNPSRERMQNEIAHLRSQVLSLETQLQSEYEKKASSSIWERITKRQLAACERTEKENKRLKSLVELQKELVVGMEGMLYNWQQAAAPHPQRPNVHLEPGDILLFEMLVSELDATYLKIDEAFQDADIDQPGITESFARATSKTITSSTGTLRSYLELVKVEVSPVAFDLMSPTVKICGEKQCQSPDCVKHRVKRVCDGGGDIYLHLLMALKMYTFEDEIVCVCRSIFKSDEQSPDAYLQETGWFTSENLASQRISSTSSKTGSLTRLCVHLEPKSFTELTTVIKAEADVIASHVMSCYRDVFDETNEMMENLLIQENPRNKTN